MPRTKWTPNEDAVLRKHHGKVTAAEIAEKIGRTRSAVHQRAKALGLAQAHDRAKTQSDLAAVARLHATGLGDDQVAKEIGTSRRRAAWLRAKLGLPKNGWNERARRLQAEKTRQQCEAMGISSIAYLRVRQKEELARKRGWPESLSLRSIQIVETLHRLGPMTRKQIAEATGIRWRGSRATFSDSHVPGHSYIAELQRAGLVIRLDRAIKGKGKGYSVCVYMVALGVQPCPSQ